MDAVSEERLGTLVEHLRGSGHRLTPQRLAIARVLACSRDHPSAETIFAEVRAEYPMVSLATIYNTLETLKDMGEVLEIEFSAGNRYDARQVAPHPHLACTRCGRIEDVALPDIQERIAAVAQHLPYSAVVPQVTFMGVCPACQEMASTGGDT